VRVRRAAEIGAAWSGTAAAARTRFSPPADSLTGHVEESSDAS
jgi:hypothetical protein